MSTAAHHRGHPGPRPRACRGARRPRLAPASSPPATASALTETVEALRRHGHHVVGLAGDVSDAVHRDELAGWSAAWPDPTVSTCS